MTTDHQPGDSKESHAIIVTCPCRARVRLPEDRLGQRLRCPQCQTEFVATADNQVMSLPVSEEAQSVGSSCPICQSTVEEGDVTLSCPGLSAGPSPGVLG